MEEGVRTSNAKNLYHLGGQYLGQTKPAREVEIEAKKEEVEAKAEKKEVAKKVKQVEWVDSNL